MFSLAVCGVTLDYKGADEIALRQAMKDEILGTIPAEFRVKTIEPRVARLPDGNVRMNGSGARFPETCPRCGRTPADTEVKLHFMKMRLASLTHIQPVKIPFCKRCARTLKTAQYLPAFLSGLFVAFAVPALKLTNPNLYPHVPAWLVVAVVPMLAGMMFEWAPRAFVKAGVEVVGVGKDFADLAFDDQMYAEKFVEMNRLSFNTATSRPFVRRWSLALEDSARPSTARGFRRLWRG
jgi:hypothetical protein